MHSSYSNFSFSETTNKFLSNYFTSNKLFHYFISKKICLTTRPQINSYLTTLSQKKTKKKNKQTNLFNYFISNKFLLNYFVKQILNYLFYLKEILPSLLDLTQILFSTT